MAQILGVNKIICADKEKPHKSIYDASEIL